MYIRKKITPCNRFQLRCSQFKGKTASAMDETIGRPFYLKKNTDIIGVNMFTYSVYVTEIYLIKNQDATKTVTVSYQAEATHQILSHLYSGSSVTEGSGSQVVMTKSDMRWPKKAVLSQPPT